MDYIVSNKSALEFSCQDADPQIIPGLYDLIKNIEFLRCLLCKTRIPDALIFVIALSNPDNSDILEHIYETLSIDDGINIEIIRSYDVYRSELEEYNKIVEKYDDIKKVHKELKSLDFSAQCLSETSTQLKKELNKIKSKINLKQPRIIIQCSKGMPIYHDLLDADLLDPNQYEI